MPTNINLISLIKHSNFVFNTKTMFNNTGNIKIYMVNTVMHSTVGKINRIINQVTSPAMLTKTIFRYFYQIQIYQFPQQYQFFGYRPNGQNKFFRPQQQPAVVGPMKPILPVNPNVFGLFQ